MGYGLGGFQAMYGMYQSDKAARELQNLPDEQKYKSAQEILTESKSGAKGFTAAEKLAFFQNQVRQANQQYAKAISYRPDLAGTIQAGINYGGVTSNNQFAANDAQLRRQDEQRRAGLIQSQDARNVQSFNQNIHQRQQALGQAKQAGIQNIFSGASQIDNQYNQDQYYDKLDKYYGYNQQPTATGKPNSSAGYTFPQAAGSTSIPYNSNSMYTSPSPVNYQSAYSAQTPSYGQSFNPNQPPTYYQPSSMSPNQPPYKAQYPDYTKSFYNY